MPKHYRKKTRKTRKTKRRHTLRRRTLRGGYNPIRDNGVYPGKTVGYPNADNNWALPDPQNYTTGINQVNGPSAS